MKVATFEAARFQAAVHELPAPEDRKEYLLDVAIDRRPGFIATERDLRDVQRAVQDFDRHVRANWSFSPILPDRLTDRLPDSGLEYMAATHMDRLEPVEGWSLTERGRFGLECRSGTIDRSEGLCSWDADFYCDREQLAVMSDDDAADLRTIAAKTDELVNQYLRQGKSVRQFAEDNGFMRRQAPEPSHEANQALTEGHKQKR